MPLESSFQLMLWLLGLQGQGEALSRELVLGAPRELVTGTGPSGVDSSRVSTVCLDQAELKVVHGGDHRLSELSHLNLLGDTVVQAVHGCLNLDA